MSRTHAIRWSDNDRCLGPLTYSRNQRGYSPFAAEVGTVHNDEDERCRLRLSAFGHTLIMLLPPLVRFERRWVDTSRYEWSKGPGSGHWDCLPRSYGFSYGEGFLNLMFGRQTHDSSTEQRKGYFVPWANWRFVRHSLYGLVGEHVWTEPRAPKTKLKGDAFALSRRSHWDAIHDAQEACPSRTFAFKDFDGEELTATTRIEEREWRFGTGWCSWLSLFGRPKVRRSLDIRFSNETGRRKGSWKGGTMGTGIDMLPSVGRHGEGAELHESAFRRYCAAHEMTFIGEASQ